MFYEQSNDGITWAKLAYTCGRAFRIGFLLGHVIVLGLVLYWYTWRPAVVKKVDQFAPGMTSSQQIDYDGEFGPHTVETGLEGLAYYQRSVYYQRPEVVKRYDYAVILVPIIIVLATGAFAALILFLASVGRVRWREPDAVRRARYTMGESSHDQGAGRMAAG